NFAYYESNFYLWCETGRIDKFDDDLVGTTITGDAASLEAPPNGAGKNQYSIAVNDNGIFVYADVLPSKADWYQPIISEKLLNISVAFESAAAPSFPDGSAAEISDTTLIISKDFYNAGINDTWKFRFWWGNGADDNDRNHGSTVASDAKGAALPASSVYTRDLRKDIDNTDLPSTTYYYSTRRYDMEYYVGGISTLTNYAPTITGVGGFSGSQEFSVLPSYTGEWLVKAGEDFIISDSLAGNNGSYSTKWVTYEYIE
ncbi:unnamed protein product, partial [marine sediment metagenome]